MSRTACFVTRNHEVSLGRAITSVSGLAREVVVVDTGSTDRTIAIATDLGAKVVPFAWADDFSAACNASLDNATGDCILWMNPDEELDPLAVPLLMEAADDPKSFAWLVRIQQETRPNHRGYGTADWEVRMYRRDPKVRYRGRLHPDFVTPLGELAAKRGQALTPVNAMIRRHAYLSKPTPDKIRWVVRLLEAELRDRPGQLGFTIELGRNLLWLNDPRGHELLGTAADQVWQLNDAPVAPSPWVGSLIEYLLTVSPEHGRSQVTREQARQLAEKWFPKTPPVVWAVAGERFKAEDFPAAAKLLQQLIEMGQSGIYDGAGGFAPHIIGTSAVQNLGICFLRMNRPEDAKACFSQLLNEPEFRDAARLGMQQAQEMLSKPA